jgi:hypothetical protein
MTEIDSRRPVGLLYGELRALVVSALGASAAALGVGGVRDVLSGSGSAQLIRASRRNFSHHVDRASVGQIQYHRILDTLDLFDTWNGCKYARSYVQKQLHREYVNACLDIIFRDSWSRDQATAMAEAGISRIEKKVAVAMPRRFGKSFSIGIFVASVLCSMQESGVTITVYSSGLRASTNLLLIVKRFLNLIPGAPEQITVDNQETLILRAGSGPERKIVSLPCPNGVSCTHSPRSSPPPQVLRSFSPWLSTHTRTHRRP